MKHPLCGYETSAGWVRNVRWLGTKRQVFENKHIAEWEQDVLAKKLLYWISNIRCLDMKDPLIGCETFRLGTKRHQSINNSNFVNEIYLQELV